MSGFPADTPRRIRQTTAGERSREQRQGSERTIHRALEAPSTSDVPAYATQGATGSGAHGRDGGCRATGCPERSRMRFKAR